MILKNFKEAHEYYKYPGSHRIGSYGNENGIIRSYSNGKKGDIIKDNKIYYVLKNENIKEKFKLNIKNNKKIRFFIKQKKWSKRYGFVFY